MGDTHIAAYTDPGDAFDSLTWGASVLESGGINIDVSWNSYAYSYGPLSFAATYEYSTEVDLSYGQAFENDYELARQAKSTLPRDYELCDPGHKFFTVFHVGHYSTPGSKYANVKFIYDLANGLDYTYGGQKTDTEYVLYTSGY